MQSGILRQQANAISNSILSQLTDKREGYVNAENEVKQRSIEAVGNSSQEIIDKSSQTISQPSANTVASNNVMLKVLELLKELKDDVKNTKRKRNEDNDNTHNNNSGRNNCNTCSGNNNNNNNSNQRDQNQQRKRRNQIQYNVLKYFWLCGATNHPSQFCKKKKSSHKSEATFSNRIGGLTEYCQVITEMEIQRERIKLK